MSRLILAATLLAVSNVLAICPTEVSNINSFLSLCRGNTFQLTCLNANNMCSGATAPGELYADCTTSTLAQVFTLSSQSCETVLGALGPASQSDSQKADQAKADCGMTVAAYITAKCKARTCPESSDLLALLPLAKCIVTVPSSLSAQELAGYNAYSCLQEAERTAGVPAACQKESAIEQFKECNKNTEDVVQSIIGGAPSGNACSSVLIGPLSKYCTTTFGQALQDFCTPTFCQQPFPGSSSTTMCTGVGAIAGAVVAITLVSCLCLYLKIKKKFIFAPRSSSHYSNPISGGYGGSNPQLVPMQGSMMHMKGNSPPPGMHKQPSFGALVPPGPSAGYAMGFAPPGPGSPGSFSQPGFPQQQGGSFARYPQSPMMGNPPQQAAAPPQLPASKTMDPTTQLMRKGELIDFYQYHDPNREDIPAHVDRLFDKYAFQSIADAVRGKYGLVPPGWS